MYIFLEISTVNNFAIKFFGIQDVFCINFHQFNIIVILLCKLHKIVASHIYHRGRPKNFKSVTDIFNFVIDQFSFFKIQNLYSSLSCGFIFYIFKLIRKQAQKNLISKLKVIIANCIKKCEKDKNKY